MTKVKLGECFLQAQGHADYGPYGQDIVCAAISILEYAAAAAIIELENDGLLMAEPVIRLEPGDVLLSCKPTETGKQRAEEVFRVAGHGMQLLAGSYAACIQII